MIETIPFKVICVPGIPTPKLRPRVTKSGRAYTPTKTKQWEAYASAVIVMEWGATPIIDRPITVGVTAVFPRPKRRPKHVHKDWWESGLRVYRPTRPDLDNLVKAVLDATQNSGVLADDSLVVELMGRKLYAGINDGPQVIISFMEVTL